MFFTKIKEKIGVQDKSQNYVSKEMGKRLVFLKYCNGIIAQKNILIFESHVYKKRPLLLNSNQEQPLFPPLLN